MVRKMENIWNRQVKKLVLILIFIFFSEFIVFIGMQRVYRQHTRLESNRRFALFLGNIKEYCPEIQEEEWIQFLNREEYYGEGQKILNAYGILEKDRTFESQERKMGRLLWCSSLGLIITDLGIFTVVISYLKRRQKKIDELTKYMFQVEQGNYTLDYEQNEEDDLSSLKNELYKITVLLKEQAQTAKRQREALAESVSDISHQLKTPLTSVMVLVDNLAESNEMPESTRKHFLSEITRQLTGVTWLIATLLKLSRLDAGVVELEEKPLSLGQILQETLEDLEMMAEWKQITFSFAGIADGIFKGDAHWLKEAFANIIKNAIEHSRENSEIAVRLQENSVYTQVTIRDYGEGMTQEEQRHIFERFYQKRESKSGTRNKKTYGNIENFGIGLALAKEIIEKQGGYITVESKLQEGTCFFIKFIKNQ